MRFLQRLKFMVNPQFQGVSIEPTNDCNMDCGFCHRKRRPIGYMSLEQFRGLIDQVPEGMPVTLSYGGESIVHPKFREMAEYAKKWGHKVTVYSNGLEPYPEGVETIVYAKPPPIIFTWDQRFRDPIDIAPTYTVCPEPFYNINVLWNGDVVPCCHCVSGNRVVGNAFREGLGGVWGNASFTELRLRGHCEGCEVYRYKIDAETVERFGKRKDPNYRVRLN